VWSENAKPFKAKQGYNHFGVYKILEHDGDGSAAVAALRVQGYGSDDSDVDLSGILVQSDDEPPSPPAHEDPGPMPKELLRVPGFISELMDYCVENAPIRNYAMAFCGALALQSLLGGRKVRDSANNRTNIYLIALAPTGGGKDYPRKINSNILNIIGMERSYVLRFGSGESVEDKLAETPCVLCQTDEIDGLLLQVKNTRDSRFEALMDRLKEIYTSSDTTMITRCLVGKETRMIHQPSLTIFGTAVPVHYYTALSERMLSDGFFSRTISIEANSDIEDQEPSIIELPERIIETALWWAKYTPTPGNIANHNPEPATVPMTDEAKAIIADVRAQAREKQDEANAKNDVVTAAVWSRVRQMTRKLALIYAISADYLNPQIDTFAMSWARDFAIHQAKRMLFMASDHVSENPFHAQCLKMIKRLREAPEQTAKRSVILAYLKCKAAEMNEIVDTLEQQGRIKGVTIMSRTKPAHGYQLLY
jgi:hypothetical protein